MLVLAALLEKDSMPFEISQRTALPVESIEQLLEGLQGVGYAWKSVMAMRKANGQKAGPDVWALRPKLRDTVRDLISQLGA